jgi:hypothetical protein
MAVVAMLAGGQRRGIKVRCCYSKVYSTVVLCVVKVLRDRCPANFVEDQCSSQWGEDDAAVMARRGSAILTLNIHMLIHDWTSFRVSYMYPDHHLLTTKHQNMVASCANCNPT